MLRGQIVSLLLELIRFHYLYVLILQCCLIFLLLR